MLFNNYDYLHNIEGLNLPNDWPIFCFSLILSDSKFWYNCSNLEAKWYSNQNKALTWCINSVCSSIVTQTMWAMVSVDTPSTTVTSIKKTTSIIGFIIAMAISNQLSIITIWKSAKYILINVQARLWACGRGDVSTPSFGSHLNPISTKGGRLCLPYTGVHTKFWKPQARLLDLSVFW